MNLFQPLIQYGFAGFSLLLLGLLFWLIQKLICLLRDNQSIIADNTRAIAQLITLSEDSLRLQRKMHEQLLVLSVKEEA